MGKAGPARLSSPPHENPAGVTASEEES